MNKAYLFLHFRIQKARNLKCKRVVFSHVAVYSSNIVTQRADGKEVCTELCHATGESYDAAIANLKELCSKVPLYSWALPWVEAWFKGSRTP